MTKRQEQALREVWMTDLPDTAPATSRAIHLAGEEAELGMDADREKVGDYCTLAIRSGDVDFGRNSAQWSKMRIALAELAAAFGGLR